MKLGKKLGKIGKGLLKVAKIAKPMMKKLLDIAKLPQPRKILDEALPGVKDLL